ncbi:hypothetical protein BSNK01_11800 [Bacillaceae bacterium]
MVARAYSQVLEAIQQAENNIRQQFQEQMGGVDPATQQALNQIRETVNRQRQDLMEEMSRRGLLQSGIWLEMESRLNEGQLSAEQRLLGERLADLQNRLNQALLGLSQARINAAQQYTLEGLNQVRQDVARQQELAERNLERALSEAWRARQYALQELSSLLPYYMPSWTEEDLSNRQWTDLMGQVPNTTSTASQSDPRQQLSQAYEIWGSRWTVDNSGNIYKDGRWVPSSNYRYVPDTILQRAREVKRGRI